MPRTATANYHVHSPDRQAFEIDAGGIAGNLIAPELVATSIPVADVRREEASVNFQRDSVDFASLPTQVASFADEGAWRPVYEQELREFLRRELPAKEVVVFDHTLRVDDPAAVRGPARNVHSDYSPQGARRRLDDILGADEAARWARGHYGFVNVWRPIESPINSAPLGFVRPSSVSRDDWVLIDLIYPDRRGHIMGLVANENHEWIYMSKMTPDEIAFFNIYDNRGLASLAHSALNLVEDEHVSTIRKSIESRTLIRY